MRFSDKIIYCLNSAAVGDLVAATPSVKWAIENFHQNTDYRVAVFPEFRELYPFVPDDKIIPLDVSYDKNFAVRKLNMEGGSGNVCRLTPARFRLIDYASIGLLGRLLPDQHLIYPQLPDVDVSHFGIDFSKAVVFICTNRDHIRAWRGEELTKTAQYVHSKGFMPVFVGRTGLISIWKKSATTDFVYPGFGIDLLNKTSLSEMATIMKKSRAILGIDSGPLHIAFTTDTPIIAGFTYVRPSLRIPPRNENAKTVAVVPQTPCRFCHSDWQLDFWQWANCPRGLAEPECVKEMGSELFIRAFDKLNLIP